AVLLQLPHRRALRRRTGSDSFLQFPSCASAAWVLSSSLTGANHVFGILIADPKKAFRAEPGELNDFAIASTRRTQTFVPRRVAFLRSFSLLCHDTSSKGNYEKKSQRCARDPVRIRYRDCLCQGLSVISVTLRAEAHSHQTR